MFAQPNVRRTGGAAFAEPPDSAFFLVQYVSDGDITKHAAIYAMPLERVYAVAAMKIAQQEFQERELERLEQQRRI